MSHPEDHSTIVRLAWTQIYCGLPILGRRFKLAQPDVYDSR